MPRLRIPPACEPSTDYTQVPTGVPNAAWGAYALNWTALSDIPHALARGAVPTWSRIGRVQTLFT